MHVLVFYTYAIDVTLSLEVHLVLKQLLYPTGCCDNTVGNKVEVKANSFKDVFEELDDLEGQHVLSNIVPDLEDASLPHGHTAQPLGEVSQRGWRV